MSEKQRALRARFVFPVAGPPIQGATVVIDGAKIAEVGSRVSATFDDLGNVAILPGLVNAHTHLEFSDLAEPLGTPNMRLPEWIRGVMRQRHGRTDAMPAIRRGLEEGVRAGTTALGEIATFDWRASCELPAVTPTTVMFHEAIGPTLERAREAAAAAEAFLAAGGGRSDVHVGLSPHALYTVHPRLLLALVEMSRRFRVPVAMHLAESREELELLRAGSGPFRELLEAGGAWEAAAGTRLTCIFDYLLELARAPKTLVIHGNYLSAEETAFLAEHSDTMSVVYCPRTHAFFGHDAYPLARLLAAGVNVSLGTDSRASNPDLSVYEEMRFAAARHGGIDPAAILRLATLEGARALGIAEQCGTIEPGKRADLAIVALGDERAGDPHELLFAGASRVVATYVGGKGEGRRQKAEGS